MNDKRKRTILSVVGMIVLLIVCAFGVQAVFAGLGMVSTRNGGVSSSQSAQADGDGANQQFFASLYQQKRCAVRRMGYCRGDVLPRVWEG